MNSDLKSYLIKLLSALGQMNHPSRLSGLDGVMLLKTDMRRDLIAEGWEILNRPNENGVEELCKALSEVKTDCQAHTCNRRNERIDELLKRYGK
jgi:hypothetical protein